MRIQHRIDPHHGIYVRETGPELAAERGRGAVLFVHGLGESGLGFEHLLLDPSLGAWRSIAVDLPGYGKSPWPEAPLSLADHADRLAAWIAAEGLSPLVVVGHSMGGVVGQLLCERQRDAEGDAAAAQVAGFCNVEGNLSPGDCTYSGQAIVSPLQDFVEHDFDRLRESVYAAGANDGALRTYYASLRMCDPRLFHRNSAELVELSRQEALAERLASLAIPRIYVAGAPRGGPPRSRQLLRQSGLEPILVEPAGHWPFLDQPCRFLAVLGQFLARL